MALLKEQEEEMPLLSPGPLTSTGIRYGYGYGQAEIGRYLDSTASAIAKVRDKVCVKV